MPDAICEPSGVRAVDEQSRAHALCDDHLLLRLFVDGGYVAEHCSQLGQPTAGLNEQSNFVARHHPRLLRRSTKRYR